MSNAPWFHWPVAGLALVWALLGVADYLLFQSRMTVWTSYFTPDQIAYFGGLPIWATVLWAFAVWGGLAGALALARRLRGTPALLAVSFIGWMGLAVGLMLVRRPPLGAVTGPIGEEMLLGAATLAFVFFFYARGMNITKL